MPANYLSAEILDYLDKNKIDRSFFHLSGNRIGSYYLPQGADLKNAGVIYDRAYSSFAELEPGMIDWEKALDQASWFHFSAISPALNERSVDVCIEALKAAQKKQLVISVDLNYRAKLWQYGKLPEKVMPRLVEYCNVVMGNLWAADQLLGIKAPIRSATGLGQQQLIDYAANSMEELQKHYPAAKTIAYTYRLDQTYFGVLHKDGDLVASRETHLPAIIDKVGSGDCFMAGLIYGLTNHWQPQEIIDFASAAAITKLQVKGDATNLSVPEIQQTLKNEWTA
jgi:2-dehydro-3-deoxygluconokinase